MELYGYQFSRDEDLSHHGILGQKWGKRNGPPYPLGAGDHSASEKKAGWRKSLDKKVDSGKEKTYTAKRRSADSKKLTPEQKKRLAKIGLGVAVGVLAVGGAVYLAKTGKFNALINNGQSAVEEMFGGSASAPRCGKTQDQINADVVAQMNEGPLEGRDMNCFHTSCGYILNELFGINCKALPFHGVDEASGMKTPGRSRKLFHAIFDGINEINCEKDAVSVACDKIPSGTTGVLHVRMFGENHFLNYEKAENGALTFVDCQTNHIFDSQSPFDKIHRIMDFSNATLNSNADSILSNIIERTDNT